MKIAVIGLGYVGLPLARELAKHFGVIGFDINQQRIDQLSSGLDITKELSADVLQQSKIEFTVDVTKLEQADFYIVTVPTPVGEANQPDFGPLISASELIGKTLEKNNIVVYESTVYPGGTEEVCIPVLETFSSLVSNKDFFVGYSPERINPSDKVHTLTNTQKIVSAQDEETLNKIAEVYQTIVEAGVWRATSIKVAEAAKVIENSQRDINIAFMNELALICHRIGIDTQEVLDAAGTKWNFLKFKPGLVGGHCISVDPYYLTYKAASLGYLPEIMLAGRRVNDGMGFYIARCIVKHLNKQGLCPESAKIGIMGITFKENCPDIRNSKVFDIISELTEFGASDIRAYDPVANADDVRGEYNIELSDFNKLHELDVLVIAVQHTVFLELKTEQLMKMMKPGALFVDVKSAYNKENFMQAGFKVWRL